MRTELFYLQDSRSYVGNDMLFWATGGKGYSTDLRRAETYTAVDAQRMHDSRPTDIPWPKEYIDARTRPAVDMQTVKKDALAGFGITLKKVQPVGCRAPSCAGCGRFLKAEGIWSRNCMHCGKDNRP